jgi:hypothetical protein
MLGRGDDAVASRISAASLHGAPALLAAPDAGAFVARFDGLLAADPELRAYRL